MALCLLALLVATTTAHADRTPQRVAKLDHPAPAPSEHTAPPDRFLAASDVFALVKPQAAQIERCYLDAAGDVRGAGHLDLTLVIARDGYVISLKAATPKLPAKATKAIETCVRSAVEVVKFPTRRNDTTAVVPYFFQRTAAPSCGPQLSCWNPKGC